MQRRHLLLLGVACLLALSVPARAEDGRYDLDEDEEEYGDEDDGEYDDGDEPFWVDIASRVQRAVDSEGLLRARRWGNIANGALLGATGPVTFLVSIFSMRLSSAVLSIYLTAMGATLAALELGFEPVAPWVRENLSYLSTPRGHTALISIAGGLTWTFGKAGLLPAILTCLNALFNAYFPQVLSFIESDDDEEADCDDDEFDEQPPLSPPPPDTLNAEAVDPSLRAMEEALQAARKRGAVQPDRKAQDEQRETVRSAKRRTAASQSAASGASAAGFQKPPEEVKAKQGAGAAA